MYKGGIGTLVQHPLFTAPSCPAVLSFCAHWISLGLEDSWLPPVSVRREAGGFEMHSHT